MLDSDLFSSSFTIQRQMDPEPATTLGQWKWLRLDVLRVENHNPWILACFTDEKSWLRQGASGSSSYDIY